MFNEKKYTKSPRYIQVDDTCQMKTPDQLSTTYKLLETSQLDSLNDGPSYTLG
jgi:hypothetical protein